MNDRKNKFLYDLDERPPFWRNLFYGIQCAVLMLSTLTVLSTLAGAALQLSLLELAAMVQRVLMVSGLMMIAQFYMGHRYPMLGGPSLAVTLTIIALAPYGGAVVMGGMMVGGACLVVISLCNLLRHMERLFTANVTAAVILLIAFSLLGSITPKLAGISSTQPDGDPVALLLAFFVLFIVCVFSVALDGIWRSLSILIGMASGYLICFFLDRVDTASIRLASWYAIPGMLPFGAPRFLLPAVLPFVFAYLVVLVNFMGSIFGMAEALGHQNIEKRLRHGLGISGVAGIVAGIFGAIGTVPKSTSPGVVLTTRVASYYAQLACGFILVAVAFIPKLAAVLAGVPDPVIGGAILVILSSQVSLGIRTATRGKEVFSTRDGFVIGLPVLIGTALPLLPSGFFQDMPLLIAAFLRNGLAVGMLAVILLEHFVKKNNKA
jgi:xanthine/uracil permease